MGQRIRPIILGFALLAVGIPTATAQASSYHACKPSWIADHGYYVHRLSVKNVTCSVARAALDRFISTGRAPHGWSHFQPSGRAFVGGMKRGNQRLRFNGSYAGD